MARPQIPTFNWRYELSRLERFLRKDGGVIHIRTKIDSPSSAFVKALRSKMEHETWSIPWQTIQFEGNNASTHYFGDMLDQIERSLAISPCSSLETSTVTIGRDIDADGDVHIGNITVNNGGNGSRFHIRAELITEHMSTIHKEKRIGLIFFDSDNADHRELAAFRTMLWDGRLEQLVDNGLLLIVFMDNATNERHWLPDPDEIIELPDQYDEKSAKNAIEDLAAFALTEQFCRSEEEAKGFAKTLIASHKPKDLYANLAAVLSKIGQLS